MHSIDAAYCDRCGPCVCLCVVRMMYCTKTAETIEMPFGELTQVGPWKHVLDGGRDQMNPIATARIEKSSMRPFVRLLWTLIDDDL